MVEVHRCRFVDYKPHTITSLSFSHPSTTKFAPADLRLAVARNNGDIEIWNPKHRWIQETVLYGARDASVEGVVWATKEGESPRLFSIGGSTVITEWDLKTGLPLKNFDCNAAIIWSIAINESQDKIAVGCDDGSVVVVDISGGVGSIEHFAFLQRQDHRVLSLTFKGDDFIIGGCADGRIRVWNFNDNRYNLVSTMRVDKSKKDATLVWSVIYLSKLNQIVTGDSTGSVKFWDFTHFTLLQSFKVHDADILTLSSDLNNENVFSAGVDRKIFNFQHIDQQNKPRWINTSNRLFHSNDIRSMISYESKNYDFLISGGVEKTVVLNSIKTFSEGNYKKLSFVPQEKHVLFNKSKKLVVLWQDQTVKIWRLAPKKVELLEDGEIDETSETFKDSYELVSKLTLADEENISTVAISQDGSILAVGRLTTTKLFKLTDKAGSNKLKVSKVDNLSISNQGSRHLVFYGNESLILTTPENEIYKFKLDSEESDESDDNEDRIIVEYELSELPRSKSKLPFIENINHVKTSHNKLIVSRICGAIDIIDLDSTSKFEAVPFLRLSSYINRLEISPRMTLIALTHENKIYEFDLTSSTNSSVNLTTWSKVNSEFLPLEFIGLEDTPLGLFFDAADQYKIWVYGSTWLSYFNLKLNIPVKAKRSEKKRNRAGNAIGVIAKTGEEERLDAESDEEQDELLFDPTRLSERLEYSRSDKSTSGTPFWITHKYKPILFVDGSITEKNAGQLVIVERPYSALEQAPAFKLNQFRV